MIGWCFTSGRHAIVAPATSDQAPVELGLIGLGEAEGVEKLARRHQTAKEKRVVVPIRESKKA